MLFRPLSDCQSLTLNVMIEFLNLSGIVNCVTKSLNSSQCPFFAFAFAFAYAYAFAFAFAFAFASASVSVRALMEYGFNR